MSHSKLVNELLQDDTPVEDWYYDAIQEINKDEAKGRLSLDKAELLRYEAYINAKLGDRLADETDGAINRITFFP